MKHQILPGLFPCGPMARAIPPDWGRLGREGLVVEFVRSDGTSWTGNFKGGVGGTEGLFPYPDSQRVLVLATGDAFLVDPETGSVAEIATGVDRLWPVHKPVGLIFSLQGLALSRVSTHGTVWRTRRLSWDGLEEVFLTEDEIGGLAWDAIDQTWMPFSVDLHTGASRGGPDSVPETKDWGQLAAGSDGS